MTNPRQGTVIDTNPKYDSTYEIFGKLKITTETETNRSDSPTESLESWDPGQSCVIIPPTPLLPATLQESDLIFFSNSDDIKAATGVKNSAHSVEIVSYPDSECDFLFSPVPSYEMELKQFNDQRDTYGDARYAYLMTVDKKFYYLDKLLRLATPIPLTEEQTKKLYEDFNINPLTEKKEFIFVKQDISKEDIKKINVLTGHIHCKGFLKRNICDPLMCQEEAAACDSFKALGSRNFPTGYAVRDKHNQDVAVLSKDLPGFISNRDKPLEESDLTIDSLKNMIKKRNEEEEKEIKDVIEIVSKMLALLDRSGSWFNILNTFKNCGYQLFGSNYKAINISNPLLALTRENPATVTFGKLELLRQLLINRRKEIKSVEGSLFSSQHAHEKELLEIDKAVEKLNHILLDEIALYMKEMKKLDKELQENWVDIEAEKLNPNSKYKNLKISEGLRGHIDVKLEDIRRFRIHCGQAVGLTTRYFRKDSDPHSQNIAADGKGIDCGNAIEDFTHRYVCPNRKKSTFDYHVDDFIEFPNLKHASIRYWAADPHFSDQSADALLSLTCDITKNFFKPTDNTNYGNLEHSPVFSFQKYIQVVIETLLNEKIFAAIAKLHFNDNSPMIKEDGNPDVLLPLYDDNGHKQDARSVWIKMLSERAEEAKTKLTLKLLPLKNILERQSDFVLECVLETVQLFLEDKKVEFKNKPQAIKILEDAIKLEEIKKDFYVLKEQILNPPQNEFINHGDSVVINISTIPYPEQIYENYSPSQSTAPRLLG